MTKPKLDRKRALLWRAFATIVLLIAALYVLGRHARAVSASLHTALQARPGWLLFSVLCMACTFCTSAALYGVLALHRLRYSRTLLVETACGFMDRLLPVGLGGLGLNGVYLYRSKHTPAEATAVVSVNNLIGMCAHLLILALVLAFRPRLIRILAVHYHFSVWWAGALLAAMVAVLCLGLPFGRRTVRFGRNLLVSLRREKPHRLAAALLLGMLLTSAYTLVLYGAARSAGVGASVPQLFIIFSLCMLTGTATPTPGGLVGAEAGLFGGFVAYGVPLAQAGAAVLLFRLVSYWLPLLPGLAALLLIWKRRAI